MIESRSRHWEKLMILIKTNLLISAVKKVFHKWSKFKLIFGSKELFKEPILSTKLNLIINFCNVNENLIWNFAKLKFYKGFILTGAWVEWRQATIEVVIKPRVRWWLEYVVVRRACPVSFLISYFSQRKDVTHLTLLK